MEKLSPVGKLSSAARGTGKALVFFIDAILKVTVGTCLLALLDS
jgi:hypothetical protein